MAAQQPPHKSPWEATGTRVLHTPQRAPVGMMVRRRRRLLFISFRMVAQCLSTLCFCCACVQGSTAYGSVAFAAAVAKGMDAICTTLASLQKTCCCSARESCLPYPIPATKGTYVVPATSLPTQNEVVQQLLVVVARFGETKHPTVVNPTTSVEGSAAADKKAVSYTHLTLPTILLV